jgi:hypothetical protein
MTALGAHAATLAALTTAAGVVMARIGIRGGGLRVRAQHRCVACGTVLRARVCPRCGGSDRR